MFIKNIKYKTRGFVTKHWNNFFKNENNTKSQSVTLHLENSFSFPIFFS